MKMAIINCGLKINLSLHITGQRDDGYHTLSSLVGFSRIGGDILHISMQNGKNNHLDLKISGPFADILQKETIKNNLIYRLYHDILRIHGDLPALSIHLIKNSPIGAGLGGGSCDAAGLAQYLSAHHGVDTSAPEIKQCLMALGADIPMCLLGRAAHAGGIGEKLTPLDNLPPFGAIIIAPPAHSSTPAIYNGYHHDHKGYSNAIAIDDIQALKKDDHASWIRHLESQRNDLQDSAVKIHPQINEALALLNGLDNTLLTRMSGSGSACFVLFETLDEAEETYKNLQGNLRNLGYWGCVTSLH